MLINRIHQDLKQAFEKAFQVSFQDAQIEITRSTHERYGHYQCNSAMKLTKTLQKPPREIANAVIALLQENEDYEKIEIAGPGFINLSLKAKAISALCTHIQKDAHLGVTTPKQQKIVIDFSSPNTAKEMHVGHLRSTIIGDALARLLTFQGHQVLRLNHVGDWGTAFGMLIAYLKKYEPDVLDGKKVADLSFLVQSYKTSKKIFDEDPDFKKQSQLEVVKLQSGEKDSLRAWEMICEISRKAYQEIYDLLDIQLIERGESYYQPYLNEIITLLESKNLITISDGAKCMFLPGFNNREGEPLPFILQKSDGGFNYATTDMASIRHRIVDEKADRLIYVVDAGQSTHFAMLFKAAELAGILNPEQVQANHVPFGLVLGQDGKKFKTRSGETERLMDLINNGIQRAKTILEERSQEKHMDMDDAQLTNLASVLGINAIKYADLSCNRSHDYVFSYEKMLRFEGNTAAFLMYSYVRIHGIKRKIQNAQIADTIELVHPSEISLGLHLCQFAEIIESIAHDLMPNRLCDYLFELSEKFNAFFRDCRVEGSPEQDKRLALCALTENVLETGMKLLGLKTVDRM